MDQPGSHVNPIEAPEAGSTIDPDTPAASLERSRWPDLVRQRRLWCWSEGYPLLLLLDRLLEEAPAMAETLGYASPAALVGQGYGLDLVIGAEGMRRLQVLLKPGQSAQACACCGQAIVARRRDARYCSNRCRARASRERRRSSGPAALNVCSRNDAGIHAARA